MKTFINKFVIKYLLKRLGRERVPTSGEEALKNDDLYIHVYGFDERYPDRACTVLSIENDKIECRRTEIDNQEICKSINIQDLGKYSIEVLYFYKSCRITYNGIIQPFFHIVLGINYLKRIYQKKYDKSLKFYNDRIGLLKLILEHQRRNGFKDINYYDILTNIYGPRIHTSEESYRHYQNTKQILLSLKESGDIDLTDRSLHVDTIKVLPKAFKTLADFEVENTRHSDSVKITQYQLWVAIALAALTAFNVYVTYKQYQNQTHNENRHNKSIQATP